MHRCDIAAFYDRNYQAVWYADPIRQAVTREAHSWAHSIGVHLHDYFSGAADRLQVHEAVAMLAEYRQWNVDNFVGTVRWIERLAGGGNGVRAMHFHTLSFGLLGMWRPLLGAGPPPSVKERRQSQIRLALHAARMTIKRHENLEGNHRSDDPAAASILQMQNGMLSETDTAIVILEMVRRSPDIVVIPAPPQFESGSPGRNVDLFVIDVRAETVNGIQVKTSLHHSRQVLASQREGLVFVDGVTDLGNQRLARRSPNSSTKVLTAWPGLISAHYVLRANPRNPLFAPWSDEIEEVQAELPDLVFGTTDYLDRAVAQLRGRILGPLASGH